MCSLSPGPVLAQARPRRYLIRVGAGSRAGEHLIRIPPIIGALAVILVGSLCYLYLRDRGGQGDGVSPPGGALPAPGLEMVFSHEGIAGEIMQAVGDVVTPERIRVAVHTTGTDARWVCVLVRDGRRYCTLDADWTLRCFPALSNAGFRKPPPGPARTHSIYLSLTKRAIGYNRERGDRVIVVTCPESEWHELTMRWPETGETP